MNSTLANFKFWGAWFALLSLTAMASAAAKPQADTSSKKSSSSSSSSTKTQAQPSATEPSAPKAPQPGNKQSQGNRGAKIGSTVGSEKGSGGGTKKGDGGTASGSTRKDGGGTASSGPKRWNVKDPYRPRLADQVKTLSGGGREYHEPVSNRTVRTDSHGVVRKIEAPAGLAGNKLTITRTPGAGRQVVTGGPGSRVVSWGPHRGFVERPIVGRPGYVSRTNVNGGPPYHVVVYRQDYYYGRYGRFAYYRYVPAYYYGPRFYGWVGARWPRPVSSYWGGPLVAPWFGFYAGYFTPYPVYASPDLWLTDYLLAENLQVAYEDQQSDNNGTAPPPEPTSASATAPATAAPANGSDSAITPDIKADIAEEVRQQLAAEKAAADQPTTADPGQAGVDSDQAPPALSQKFFVVSSNLDVTANGQDCSLTPGDIIKRLADNAGPDGNVAVEVVRSKKGDCRASSDTTVQVKLDDLQEMNNQFRQQIDSGLQMLADNQAKGLPSAPAANQHPVAGGTANPTPGAELALAAQETDAETLEAQVRQN